MQTKTTTTPTGGSTSAKAPELTPVEYTRKRLAECADECRKLAGVQERERAGTSASMQIAAAWIDDASKAVALEAAGDPGALEALVKVFHGLRCWWQGLTGAEHSPGHGTRQAAVRTAVARAVGHFMPWLSAVGERSAIDTGELIDLPGILLNNRDADWRGAWRIVQRIEHRGAVKPGAGIGSEGREQANDFQLDDVVTLDQAAAVVSRSKRTLEKHPDRPAPDFPGGKGQAHRWKWGTIVPFLRSAYRADLPDRLPGSRLK